jgi:hypothetical protein
MYAGGRPNWWARFANRLSAKAFALGFTPHWAITLETVTPGSGAALTLPLVIARIDDREYLVSMLGEHARHGEGSRWVRNVRASGGRAIIHAGRRRQVVLEEVAIGLRAPILKAYLAAAPGARAHIPVSLDAPVSSFEAIRAEYPVFEIHYR